MSDTHTPDSLDERLTRLEAILTRLEAVLAYSDVMRNHTRPGTRGSSSSRPSPFEGIQNTPANQAEAVLEGLLEGSTETHWCDSCSKSVTHVRRSRRWVCSIHNW